jgi:hypothetical protein
VQADINVAADEFEEQLRASRAKIEVGNPLTGARVPNRGSVPVLLSAWLHLPHECQYQGSTTLQGSRRFCCLPLRVNNAVGAAPKIQAGTSLSLGH